MQNTLIFCKMIYVLKQSMDFGFTGIHLSNTVEQTNAVEFGYDIGL
jgi:hypothetical protein